MRAPQRKFLRCYKWSCGFRNLLLMEVMWAFQNGALKPAGLIHQPRLPENPSSTYWTAMSRPISLPYWRSWLARAALEWRVSGNALAALDGRNGRRAVGGFAPGEWLVPGEPAAQNPIVNDAFWSSAAGRERRVVIEISRRSNGSYLANPAPKQKLGVWPSLGNRPHTLPNSMAKLRHNQFPYALIGTYAGLVVQVRIARRRLDSGIAK